METNDEIKIEKGIPFRNSIAKSGTIKSVLKRMEIGDSFVIDKYKRGSIMSSANYSSIKVACRKEGTDKIRVWRIA